jgi:large subunit ribosomal protein L3
MSRRLPTLPALSALRPRVPCSPLPPPSVQQHQQQQRRGIRSVLKPAPQGSRYVRGPTAITPSTSLRRKAAATPLRTGLIARKKGMASVFDGATGTLRPATVLQVDGCQVVGHRTRARHGYWAVQVGSERAGPRLGAAMLGVFAARRLPPKRVVAECRVRGPQALLPLGTLLKPSWFVVGQVVDTRSRTKGKGFQGVSLPRRGFAACGLFC